MANLRLEPDRVSEEDGGTALGLRERDRYRPRSRLPCPEPLVGMLVLFPEGFLKVLWLWVGCSGLGI